MSASSTAHGGLYPEGARPGRSTGRAARRYGLVLGLSALLVLQSIAAVNIVIDPFGFFGLNQVGFYFNSEREFKPRQIHVYPHRALLMGNSKMAYVDPDDLPGYGFFNAAFSAAKPEEMLAFLEQNIEGVELIALALDHRMFMNYELQWIDLGGADWSDWLRYSLSLEMLSKSLTALDNWRNGMPSRYKANGVRTTDELRIREYLTEGIAYGDRLELRREEYASKKLAFRDDRIDVFRRMKQLFDAHSVEHVVYMNPLNRDEQEVIAWRERWLASPAHQALVAELKRIFPEFRDYSDSEFSDPTNFWPTDFKHYRPKVGAAIIQEMLAAKGLHPVAQTSN